MTTRRRHGPTGQHTEEVAPPKAEPPTAAPPGFGDTPEALEPLVHDKAKLTSDGSKAAFSFRCGAGCTLTAVAYPKGGGA